MDIFITGSSGFVGKNLLGSIKDSEYNIIELNRSDLQSGEFDFTQDSVIIHLAGKAHDLKKISSPDEYYKVNFELTKMLYDKFLKSTAKKFIFMSSVKAAADVLEDVLTEDFIPNPQTHYGKSKLLAEEYMQKQQLHTSQSYYILRPCMIHGPGNKGNLNLLYKFVSSGIPYPLAAYRNERSFLSIENLCFVINEILKKNISSGIYNIADDSSISTNEVVTILAETLHKKPKLWHISPDLLKIFAKIGDKINLPLNTERLNKLTENFVVSNNKITNAMGKPFPVGVRDGLRITAQSFNKN
jgi:nucleoside-diphosphate-sugar epimerase